MTHREELEAFLELFLQPAWHALIAHKLEEIEVLRQTALDNCATIEELWYDKGRLSEMRALARLPDEVRRQLDELDETGD